MHGDGDGDGPSQKDPEPALIDCSFERSDGAIPNLIVVPQLEKELPRDPLALHIALPQPLQLAH